ncbi:MAG: molybdopterin molybdotransferase MoeA, partial [Acidimicrobiia bacterium]|nr:molybdopterin molybdotransferase MoeA [Acidimicrobiia bacterium]
VVRVEDTEPADGSVLIRVSVPHGMSVRPAGGDVRSGEAVFAAGTRLTPPHLAVLSSLGVARPSVRRRPVVALLSTGDEVQPPETTRLAPGQIRDTNRPLLKALLAELGADVLDLGIVHDDAAALRSAIATGTSDADAMFTSGGVSMGEYDLVKQVLGELGSIGFWKVAMQPAKPFAFGLVEGTPLFGLPGNPVSVMVAFEQFARPALLTMMGSTAVFRPRVSGVLDGGAGTDPAKTVFLRSSIRWEGGQWRGILSGDQSSNVLSALAAASGFAVVPRGQADVVDGGPVEFEMFGWPEARTRKEVLGG